MDQNRPLFVYFRYIHMTRGSRIVGEDEFTELWRHPDKNVT